MQSYNNRKALGLVPYGALEVRIEIKAAVLTHINLKASLAKLSGLISGQRSVGLQCAGCNPTCTFSEASAAALLFCVSLPFPVIPGGLLQPVETPDSLLRMTNRNKY